MSWLKVHHIVSDGVVFLDDVPVEDHQTLLVARGSTELEIADTQPCWREPALLDIAVFLRLQSLQCTVAIPVLHVLLDYPQKQLH
jgi:hypothetical protein